MSRRNRVPAHPGVELSDMSNSRSRGGPSEGDYLPQLSTQAPLPSFQRHIPIVISQSYAHHQSPSQVPGVATPQNFSLRDVSNSRTQSQASTPQSNVPRHVPIIPRKPPADSNNAAKIDVGRLLQPRPGKQFAGSCVGHDRPVETSAMPKGWKRDHDLLICYMDRKGVALENMGKRLRLFFPGYKGGMPSPEKIDSRLRVLDQIVEVDYWRSKELENSGFFRKHEEAITLATAKSEAGKKENVPITEQGLHASVETYRQPTDHAKVVQIPRSHPATRASNASLRGLAQAQPNSTASSTSLRGLEQSQYYHSVLRSSQNEQPGTPTCPTITLETRRRYAAMPPRRSRNNLRAGSMSSGPTGPVFD